MMLDLTLILMSYGMVVLTVNAEETLLAALAGIVLGLSLADILKEITKHLL